MNYFYVPTIYPQMYYPCYIPIQYIQNDHINQEEIQNKIEINKISKNRETVIKINTIEQKDEQELVKDQYQLFNTNDISNSNSIDLNYQPSEKKKQNQHNYEVNQLKGSTNTLKNYAKAIINYIPHLNWLTIKILGKQEAVKFQKLIKKNKNKITNLSNFQKFTDNQEYHQMMRIIINYFLKNIIVQYIYHSKIQLKTSHLKQRNIFKKKLIYSV